MHFIKKNKFLTIVLIILSAYIYQNFTRIVSTNNIVDKSSKQYVNDLYMSDARIYKNYLNKKEKILYQELFEKTKKFETSFELDAKDYNYTTNQELSDGLTKVHYAMIIDHPELMNYATVSWRYNDEYFKVSLVFAISDAIKEKIAVIRTQRIVADIKDATKKMTDAEKIEYVYNWFGENQKYDKIFMLASKNQSIYNVFMKNNAVCAGFAKASQIIFQNIGIESYGIVGQSTGPHMWNVIKYKNKYYYFDSTVAASIKKKTSSVYYNGLTQEEMNFYQPSYKEWYPKIETENILDFSKVKKSA